MAKAENLKTKKAAADPEDAATLAAIDEGLRDAKAGRTTPIEEVRKRMPQWIAESTSRKDR
jgi:predicted transcriptional regulator